MTLGLRRVLYIVFIAAFLVITPLLILYANGYELSLGKKGFVKTGMFIFDSEPRGATIYLDGVPQNTFFNRYFSKTKNYFTTPAKIKGLKPGEYDVKFELPGYWPWQKKLSILPGNSTYAEDVILFKSNLPLALAPGEIKDFSVSPDGESGVIRTDRTYYLFDLKDETVEDLALPAGAAPLWSAGGGNVLIGDRIIRLAEPSKPLASSDFFKPILARWDAAEDDKLYYLEKQNIYAFSLADRKSTLVAALDGAAIPQTIIDFFIKDGYLFYVSSGLSGSSFNVYNIARTRLERAGRLPTATGYAFINPGNDLINLLDRDHGTLYLLNPGLPLTPVVDEIKNAVRAAWTSDKNLLYANDYEIWQYDLPSRTKRLITRLGEKITGIAWHPSGNYVIYSTDQAIKIIELDERNKLNVTEILKLDRIDSLYLTRDGRALYFYGVIGKQKGLYKLIL